MKVLLLWKYYPQYLNYFYSKNPSALGASFIEQRDMIFDDHCGWSAELAEYMNQQGIDTEFIIANAEPLQKMWARENNFSPLSMRGWEKEIVMEQIRRFRPDILWIPYLSDYFGDFVKGALSYCKKAITWISCATPENLDISGFKTLITSNPKILKEKHRLFDKTILAMPGFCPDILQKVGYVQKKYDISFVGQITSDHTKRAQLIAYLIENGVDIKIFGTLAQRQPLGKWNGIKRVAACILKYRDFLSGFHAIKQMLGFKDKFERNIEVIKTVCQSPVFGLDMYRVLAESRIALNVHIDIAGEYSGNMRMFEATGIGTCLLTEQAENVKELFEPGKEILTYKSKEELLDIIKYLLKQHNAKYVEQIAEAGQRKTLQCHTIARMFDEIRPAFVI